MKEKLLEIIAKLEYIPLDNEETMRYYIYYKEDMRELLELMEKYEGIISKYGIELPWKDE